MKLKQGMLIAIVFDDHVKNGDELMRFITYGQVAKVTRSAVTVDCWHYADPKIPRDDNTEKFTIARKAIRQVIPLAPIVIEHDRDEPHSASQGAVPGTAAGA